MFWWIWSGPFCKYNLYPAFIKADLCLIQVFSEEHAYLPIKILLEANKYGSMGLRTFPN